MAKIEICTGTDHQQAQALIEQWREGNIIGDVLIVP